MFPDKAGSILYRKMVLGTRIRTCFRGMVSKKTYREKTKLNRNNPNAKAHTLLRICFVDEIGWRSQYYEKTIKLRLLERVMLDWRLRPCFPSIIR